MTTNNVKDNRRVLRGVVIRNGMSKTIVVVVKLRFKHKIGKYVTKSNSYLVHDAEEESKIGDLVAIIESKPISKTKKFTLHKILSTKKQ
jgi:small subunit ribosomal protein S17